MSDTDLDQIVANSEASTNNEIPMEGTPPEVTPQAPPVPQEYEFEAEGRKYKGDINKLTRWAQAGVNAPNKIGELSKKLQDYEGKLKGYEVYDKTYKPIDEWAKANPDKWQALFQSWQQAQYGVNPGQQTEQIRTQLPPEVIQKLEAHDKWIAQSQEKEVIQRNREADQTLEGIIGSIRKQYSNLDFDAPDESGNSLEYRILEHATKNGIPSFKAAFRDYCFDQLNQFSEQKGRTSGQAISPKTKAGLLGKDPAPSKGRPVGDLIKNRNYDQIHELVLQDLGLRSS